MVYAITTNIVIKQDNGWSRTVGIPTFFLDSAIQGITDCQHAEHIACSMFALVPNMTIHCYAQECPDAVIVKKL